MPRRLLTPQMLVLHVVALVAVGACAWLGWWQLDRTRAFDAPTDDPAPVPITSITKAEGGLADNAQGRLVAIEGTYDPAQQFTVLGRDGDPWVLTVLRTNSSPPAGVLVVRGQGAASPPPTGIVQVSGRLRPSEPSLGAVPVAATSVTAISPVDLLSRVPYQLFDGYVVLRSQVPPAVGALQLVPSPAIPDTPPGYVWQHAGYVALWWAFGLFGLFFWYRLVRDRMADSKVAT